MGYVSMAVSDSILPQEQIDNIAEAAIRNSVTESQDAQRRRVAVALARQELHAEVEEAKRAAAQYRLELIAVIDTNKALAEQEINAVATDLSAEVTARQTLATVVDSNTAAIQTEQQARVDAVNAEALAREQLAAVVGENTAAIQTEAYTRANQIQAEAQARQTLAVTVGNNTAAIQQTSQVIANVNGQLSAKWTVQTDVNGNVAGIQLFNGGATKTAFVVAADHFMVTPPGVNRPTRVLDYNSSTGSLYINNLFVDGAWIQNATIGRLKLGYGQITSPNIAYSDQFTQTIHGNNLVRYTSPSVYAPLAGDRNCPVMVECSFLYGADGNTNVDATIYGGGNIIYTEVFRPGYYGNYYMMRTRLATTLSGSQRFFFELEPRTRGAHFSRPCISATVYYR